MNCLEVCQENAVPGKAARQIAVIVVPHVAVDPKRILSLLLSPSPRLRRDLMVRIQSNLVSMYILLLPRALANRVVIHRVLLEGRSSKYRTPPLRMGAYPDAEALETQLC